MKHFEYKELIHLRNALVILGIALGFFIWLAVPSKINLSAMDFAGYNGSGSKLIMLPLLSLPLFAFFGTRTKAETNDSTSDTDTEKDTTAKINRCVARDQVIYAAIEDVIVIAFMTVAVYTNL